MLAKVDYSTANEKLFEFDSLLNDIETAIKVEIGKKEEIEKRITAFEVESETALKEIDMWKAIGVILQVVSSQLIDNSIYTFDRLVNTGIRYMTTDEHIKFETESFSRGKDAQMRFKLKKDTGENIVSRDPITGDGLGFVDLIGVIARTSFIRTITASNKAPLFLDEPNKMTSEGYLGNIASYLSRFSSRTKKQCFLITHQEAIKNGETLQPGDKMFTVSQDDHFVSTIEDITPAA